MLIAEQEVRAVRERGLEHMAEAVERYNAPDATEEEKRRADGLICFFGGWVNALSFVLDELEDDDPRFSPRDRFKEKFKVVPPSK